MQLDFKNGHLGKQNPRRASISGRGLIASPLVRLLGKALIGLGAVCTLVAIGVTFARSSSPWNGYRSIGVLVFSQDQTVAVRYHPTLVWIVPERRQIRMVSLPDDMLLPVPLARNHPLSGLPEFLRLEQSSAQQKVAIYSLGLLLPIEGYVETALSFQVGSANTATLVRALLFTPESSSALSTRISLAFFLLSESLEFSTIEFPQSLLGDKEAQSFGIPLEPTRYEQWVIKNFSPASVFATKPTVAIRNASGRAGKARGLADKLTVLGFVPISVTDAPVQDHSVLVRQNDQHQDAIAFLEKIFGQEAVINSEQATQARADIVIVIGSRGADELIP